MLICLLLLLAARARAVIIRGPAGPYLVAHRVVPLVDHSRWDPYAPEDKPHRRRILVSVFEPLGVAPEQCEVEIISYLPPRTVDTYTVVAEELLMLPEFLFQGHKLEFCRLPSSFVPTSKPWPTVIYSPGFSASRLLASAQAQSLAAQGNVVITVDHPYEATVVEFPDGEVVYGFNMTGVTPEGAEKAVRVRTDDVLFVIDQLPSICDHVLGNPASRKVFVYGHSLGGATAASAMLQDDRVLGGLNFDGTLYGPAADQGLDRPFILAGTPIPVNSTSPPFNGFMDKLRGPKMLLTINDTKHLSFFDVPLMLALQEQDIPPELLPVIDDVLGGIDGKLLADAVNRVLTAMVRFLFRDDARGLCEIGERVKEISVIERDWPGCA